MPSATTSMDLKGTMVSGISQTKITIIWYHIYVESKKYKLLNIPKRKQNHWLREHASGYQWGGGKEKGKVRGRGLRGINYYI